MSTTETKPPALENPNVGLDNFVTSLKDEMSVDTAATETTPEGDIAPNNPPPKKEGAPENPPQKEAPREAPPKQNPAPAETDDKKWPRNAKDWEAYKKADKERLDALQKERDEIRAERDRVKSEIDTLKKGGPSPELESLKKEKAELDEQLRLVAVQNHPKFKQYFENKVGAQIEMAKRIVGAEKGEQIAALLKSPDSPLKDQQIEELVSTMTPMQQGRLAGVLNELTLIQAERESEITKARENYESMQKQQKEEAEKQQNTFRKTFDDTVKAATDPKEGNPAFQKREGDDAWNTDVDRRLEAANVLLFGKPSSDAVAKAALAAVAYPAVLQTAQRQAEEITTLKAQIAELQSATPKVETAKTPSTTTTTVNTEYKPGSLDPMSAMTNWTKSLNQPTE